MKKLLTFILTLTTATLWAANFDDWDTDNDGLIEKHEFKQNFVINYFNPWKGESTMGIIEDEFFRGVYAGLDTDGDRMLTDQEWLIGYNYYFEDYVVYEDIDVMDVNADGTIEYEEFYDVVYDTSYFSDIDLDGDNYISEHELAEFVFDNWDTNNTGIMTRSEFNRFDNYYLDI